MSRSDSRDMLVELRRYHKRKYKSRSYHILIPPTLSVAKIMQYIKGKSSRKLQDEYSELKKRYWGQHLWARVYFVATTGQLNSEDVQRYIENQEIHHKTGEFKISEF